jgi:DNA-binding transcriptional regulator YiaG
MKCDECNDTTRYVTGLWDGPNGTHGKLFDCRNLNCETKIDKEKVYTYLAEERKGVIKINDGNSIFMDLVKQKRKQLEITIIKMARSLGISPSMYCNYEQCREPLPIETLDKINSIFIKEC